MFYQLNTGWFLSLVTINTGVEVFIGSKVQCLLYFETCTTEGRKGREWKFQNKAHRTFHPRINSTRVHHAVTQVVPEIRGLLLNALIPSRSFQSLPRCTFGVPEFFQCSRVGEEPNDVYEMTLKRRLPSDISVKLQNLLSVSYLWVYHSVLLETRIQPLSLTSL